MLVLMDQDHTFDHICSYRMPGPITSFFCSHKKVFFFSRTVGLSRQKGEVIPIVSFLMLIDDIPLRYYLVQIITVKATSECIVLYLIKNYMFTYLSEFLYKSKPELSVVVDNFLLGWCSTNCSISVYFWLLPINTLLCHAQMIISGLANIMPGLTSLFLFQVWNEMVQSNMFLCMS